MPTRAYAAMAARQPLQKFEYEPGALGPNQIEVAITHCGICHSDIHLIDDDWRMGAFPLVPGHEIVGTVARTGELVRHVEKGQRVGIGWQCGSCMTCEWCGKGAEQMCKENQATCVGHHGGFADSVVVDGRFAFPIPDRLESENAAPLLCAGVTVYSPLRAYGVQPWMTVGVIGIGGLGHLALQFANALGCRVAAFSSSGNKEAEARSFGAHDFATSTDPTAFADRRGTLDFILSTVFVPLDWAAYLELLRPFGKLCFVGAVTGTLAIPAMPLIMGQKSICGSVIGGRPVIAEMLDFAARHDIKARTELMPMDQCNTAIARVRESKARYRMVLKN